MSIYPVSENDMVVIYNTLYNDPRVSDSDIREICYLYRLGRLRLCPWWNGSYKILYLYNFIYWDTGFRITEDRF
jgi:hypothetical protein